MTETFVLNFSTLCATESQPMVPRDLKQITCAAAANLSRFSALVSGLRYAVTN